MAKDKYDLFTTPEFRVSFPYLFEKNSFQNNAPEYEITMLFPKSTDLSVLKNHMKKSVEQKWPDPQKRPKDLWVPLRDGAEKGHMDGYEGCYFAKAKSKYAVGLVDAQLNPILSPEEFYPGCYARARLFAFPFDQPMKKGIKLILQSVQKTRDGEPFGRGPADAANDFDVWGPDDDNTGSGKVTAAGDASSFLN